MGLEDKLNKISLDQKDEELAYNARVKKGYDEFLEIEKKLLTPIIYDYVKIMRKNKVPFKINKQYRWGKFNPHNITIDLFDHVVKDMYKSPETCKVTLTVNKDGSWKYLDYNKNYSTFERERVQIAKNLSGYPNVRRASYSKVEEQVAKQIFNRLESFKRNKKNFK